MIYYEEDNLLSAFLLYVYVSWVYMYIHTYVIVMVFFILGQNDETFQLARSIFTFHFDVFSSHYLDYLRIEYIH